MAHHLQLRFGKMIVPIGLPLLAVAGLGAYPTHRLGGLEALEAQGLALGLAALVFFGAAAVVFRLFAGQGPAKIGYGFVILGPVRVLMVAGLAAGVWAALHPPISFLAGWLVIFYIVSLASESAWLGKALKGAAPGLACRDAPAGKKD